MATESQDELYAICSHKIISNDCGFFFGKLNIEEQVNVRVPLISTCCKDKTLCLGGPNSGGYTYDVSLQRLGIRFL